jgi:predicted nicotinamide N-methyase
VFGGGQPPPYWAFPWAGGQAVARYILDHPATVAGRRVLDVGAGSGLVAIAAARCGAAVVVATEIDPLAAAAARLNAGACGVEVAVRCEDVVGGAGGDAEVVFVGDVFYERDLAERMIAFVERATARGAAVYIGDVGRRHLPVDRLRPVVTYDVSVTAGLEDAEVKPATVWRPAA